MKLHPDKQLEITQPAIAQILSLYAISDFTFQPIKAGIENTSVYIETGGKKCVLRIYSQGKKPDNIIFLELEFQDYLRTRGIPIPHIYPTLQNQPLAIVEINGKRWQAILMEFKEGMSTEIHPNNALLAELARTQANMHILGMEFAKKAATLQPPIAIVTVETAGKIKTSPIQTKEMLDFINRAKSFAYRLDPLLPHGYNHLDLDFDGNVIVTGNTIAAIVDFDDLKYSPAVMCLGFTLWKILNDKGIEGFRYYLNEYQKVRPLTEPERQALPHIVFFRNYEVGIILLLLWEHDTPLTDILAILQLEKELPELLG